MRYTAAKIPGPEGIEIEFDRVSGELTYHRPLGQWELCEEHKTYDEEMPTYQVTGLYKNWDIVMNGFESLQCAYEAIVGMKILNWCITKKEVKK